MLILIHSQHTRYTIIAQTLAVENLARLLSKNVLIENRWWIGLFAALHSKSVRINIVGGFLVYELPILPKSSNIEVLC